MAQDVEMHDAYESDYPDPGDATANPYPLLSNGPIQVSGALRAFNSLADYLDFGNLNNDRLQTTVGSDRHYQSENDDEHDESLETPVVRHRDAFTETISGGGEDSGSDSGSSPWTTQFFNRYGSRSPSPQPENRALPGFHALPETDVFRTLPRFNQPSSYPGSVQTPRYGSPYSEDSTPRGRGRGRGRPRRGSGRGSRGYRGAVKKMLKGTSHADLFKTPPVPRDPTAGRRGARKDGPPRRKHIDPGPEYKEAAAAANQAFFAEDYDAALDHIFKAIHSNPEVYHGHLLLSEILEKQGRIRDALCAVTNGAAIKRDPEAWVQIAERYLALEEGGKQDPADVTSALKCYMEAVKLDQDNCELREGKLQLLLELEHWKAARLECKGLVRIRPAELDYVRQYASLCSMSKQAEDRERAQAAYGTAFNLLYNDSSLVPTEEHWDHLNVYLDLLLRTNKAQYALFQAKRLSRWFLGRKEDIFWDGWTTDDREFDNESMRRMQVAGWQNGKFSFNTTQYGDGLPLDIRVKMGMCRARMGLIHQPEALNHLSHLSRLSDQVENFSDMFFDVAECLRKAYSPEAAITFYEPLKAHPDLIDEKFWLGLAYCYERVGRTEDAEEGFLKVIELSPDHVDAHMVLLKLYRLQNQKVKAHAMASEIVRLGHEGLLVKEKIRVPRQRSPGRQKGTVAASHPSKKKRLLAPKSSAGDARHSLMSGALTGNENGLRPEGEEIDTSVDDDLSPGVDDVGSNQAQRIRRLKAKVLTHYTKVQELWDVMESRQDVEAMKQWIQQANVLAKIFRETKEFFPSKATHTHDKYFTHLKNGTRMQGSATMKEMLALQQQLENSAGDETEAQAMRAVKSKAHTKFQDIEFREWHRILSTLALAYAHRVAQDKCYDILQNVLIRANVFRQDPELNDTTLAVCVCCALKFNDDKFLIETVRHWHFAGAEATTKQAQLLAASGALSHEDSHLYHRYTKEWAQFAVKEQDFLAMSPEVRDGVDWGEESTRLKERAARNESGSKELDPGLLTMYAHILGSRQGGSTKSKNPGLALSYLFRALALQPENTIVNLSIAILYLANSVQDKEESTRRYTMAQGQAFLYRYYELRTASKEASHVQEAEYNMGRAWQLIGKTNLAVPTYEKVLSLAERSEEEAEQEKEVGRKQSFAQEAALALRGIYIAAGNRDAAEAITERWLVL